MSAPPPRRISAIALLLGLALVAITIGLAYRGWSFYRLSLEERPEHAEFRQLRPSGVIGNGYGWVAAMLIVMNLSYLVRRRFGSARLGSMRTWLDVHVFTGLIAASLVSFHSAFQLRTPIATASTASLALVVLTGLVGRFLYALAPAGERERLRAALDAMPPERRTELADAIGSQPGPNVPANASLVRSVLAIPAWRRASRIRRTMIAAILSSHGMTDRRARLELLRAASAEARASGVSALLRTWRGIHRFFALLMLTAVVLHAGVAWYYGYRWIFG